MRSMMHVPSPASADRPFNPAARLARLARLGNVLGTPLRKPLAHWVNPVLPSPFVPLPCPSWQLPSLLDRVGVPYFLMYVWMYLHAYVHGRTYIHSTVGPCPPPSTTVHWCQVSTAYCFQQFCRLRILRLVSAGIIGRVQPGGKTEIGIGLHDGTAYYIKM